MQTILVSNDERPVVAERILDMLDRADRYEAKASGAANDWERGFHDGMALATRVGAFQLGELAGLVEKGVFEHVAEEIGDYRSRILAFAGRKVEAVR